MRRVAHNNGSLRASRTGGELPCVEGASFIECLERWSRRSIGVAVRCLPLWGFGVVSITPTGSEVVVCARLIGVGVVRAVGIEFWSRIAVLPILRLLLISILLLSICRLGVGLSSSVLSSGTSVLTSGTSVLTSIRILIGHNNEASRVKVVSESWKR
jgi:hypothetical protein